VSWLRCQKICWIRVLGSVVIQLYAGECTPSVDRALGVIRCLYSPIHSENRRKSTNY